MRVRFQCYRLHFPLIGHHLLNGSIGGMEKEVYLAKMNSLFEHNTALGSGVDSVSMAVTPLTQEE